MFFLLPLSLTLYAFFMLRRYANRSPDPFAEKSYFPGWGIHPAVFNSPSPPDNPQVDPIGPLYMLELGSAKEVPNSSITVALLLTDESAQTLGLTITGLLEYQSAVQEVIILCPEWLLSTARSSIRRIVTSYGHAETLSTLLTLLPCPHATCSVDALIEAAFLVSTDWTLFLEDSGLQQVDKTARSLLLSPPAVTFPLGLKGFALPKSEAQEGTCLSSLASYHPADFLIPPFVLPSQIFSNGYALPDLTLDSWSALGRLVAETRPDKIGGVIISWNVAANSCFKSHSEAQDTSNRQRLSTLPIDDYQSRILGPKPSFSNAGIQRSQGRFGIFFPTLGDLTAFSQVACDLVVGGHRLDILLYTETETDQDFISTGPCVLHYHSSFPATTAVLVVSSWLSRLFGPIDVFITLAVEDIFMASLLLSLRDSEHAAATVIRLPSEDLIYSDWMGTLSLMEWRSTLYRHRF